jgi:hypothetical protein
MLNYGRYSQIYAELHVDDEYGLAGEGIYTEQDDPVQSLTELDLSEYAPSLSGNDSDIGLKIDGFSLFLTTDTSIRFYYTLDDSKTLDDFDISLAGDKKELNFGSNKYGSYIEISNICGNELQDIYELSISAKDGSGSEIKAKYGAFSYGYQAMNSSSTSESAKNVIKAMWLYNQANLAI